MKTNTTILLMIALIASIGYFSRVADCRQAMTIPADGKITVKDVGAYDPKENSREKLNGKEYIKINLSELSDICMNNEKGKLGKNYVVRGAVVREDKLDSDGRFGLVRLGIFCCVVHAVPIGLTVQYDKYGELKSNEWVKVYGRIKRVSNYTAKDNDSDPYKEVKKDFVIIPDRVVKIDDATDPYIYLFNCKQDEPYYY
jgi:uncharacterized membrane protein YcgQ (UPF0703/DUF1980 family)